MTQDSSESAGRYNANAPEDLSGESCVISSENDRTRAVTKRVVASGAAVYIMNDTWE